MKVYIIALSLLTIWSCNSTPTQNETLITDESKAEPDSLNNLISSTQQIKKDEKRPVDSLSVNHQKKKKRVYRPKLNLSVWENSNWDVKIDTIPEAEFDSSKLISRTYNPKKKRINSDSLLRQIAINYPEEIILSDSCCILKTINGERKMCKKSSSNDERASSGYSFTGKNHQFLTFYGWGYEYWWYMFYNPENRSTIGFANSPTFINDQIVYAFGNYYGEGQFEVHDVQNNKSYGFDTFSWRLINLYYDNSAFYIQFQCERADQRIKYLKVSI